MRKGYIFTFEGEFERADDDWQFIELSDISPTGENQLTITGLQRRRGRRGIRTGLIAFAHCARFDLRLVGRKC
jgi:hypothetical protein